MRRQRRIDRDRIGSRHADGVVVASTSAPSAGAAAREIAASIARQLAGGGERPAEALAGLVCFVCSSYEESFPRVVLEAMAFELPIVSTGVHGIPEIVRSEREALLVPPGDSAALASALQRLLASPEIGRALAHQARTRVAAEFDSRIILPRHTALARSLAAPSP